MSEESLFAAALEKPARERAAFLDEACGDDTRLRHRIEQLLAAQRRIGRFYNHEASRDQSEGLSTTRGVPEPADDPSESPPITSPPDPSDSEPGVERFGDSSRPYQLLDQIGQGGMGVVYRARDVRLNREVAIKFLRDDCSGESAARTRFIAEAQITGQLQHPGIPAVHELGTLPDGRPFLAMKLIKGRTLHDLLKERLGASGEPLRSLAEDSGRFIAILEQTCQAVGYAHARGVIHRDLKPANIMVGAFGEVQVMDWGLAKVLADLPALRKDAQDDAESAEMVSAITEIETPRDNASATRTGSVMGTPAYMAPEQAGGDIKKLDARSDVFGLGAILCQILTGRPPYQGQDFHEVHLKAVRGDLQEAFEKLDASGAEPSLVALCRRCLAFRQDDRPADGGAVAQEIAGIRQAAEDRARRAEFDRAEALVREGEQRKRRRVWLGLAASLLVGLIASTGLALWANHARLQAEKARLAEAAANDQAQKRLKQIEKGNEIITSIFSDLDIFKIKQGTEPLEAVLAQRLLKAAEQLEGEAVGNPLMVAAVQYRLGATLLGLGFPKYAVALFEKSGATQSLELGSDHPDTLTSMNLLARGYCELGQFPKALPLLEETLRLRKARLGAGHRDTLQSMDNLALGYLSAGQLAKALPLHEETLRLRKALLGADDRDTLQSMHNVAAGYMSAGQFHDGVSLLEETLRLTQGKLGVDHPETLQNMHHLALSYMLAGELDKALALLEKTLPLSKAKLGTGHPETLQTMRDLAARYRDSGQLDKALPLLEDALRLTQAKRGPDHPDTLGTMNDLARGYLEASQLAKALPLFEETLRLRKAKLGADHPDTLSSMNNLAAAYSYAGQPAKALALDAETLRLKKAKLGADHPDTLTGMHNLAVSYDIAGQLDKALPLYEEALRLRKARLGADHPHTLLTMSNLALAYQDKGQLDKALPLYEQAALAMERRQFQHMNPQWTVLKFTQALAQVKEWAKAETWLRKWSAALRDRDGAESLSYATGLAQLGPILLNQKKFADAEPILRNCLKIRATKQPDVWSTFNAQSMLGRALLGQKKYAAAERLILQGYLGLKARESQIPSDARFRLREAAGLVVALYEAWGRPDKLTAWRVKLGLAPLPTNVFASP